MSETRLVEHIGGPLDGQCRAWSAGETTRVESDGWAYGWREPLPLSGTYTEFEPGWAKWDCPTREYYRAVEETRREMADQQVEAILKPAPKPWWAFWR